MKKRILGLISSVLILAFVFSSCGERRGDAAMTLGDSVVTENMYQYWLCNYKADFMSTYSDMSDTDEFWSSEVTDGTSAEDFLSALVKEYVKMNLVSMYLFDEYGLAVPEEDAEKANQIVDDMKDYAGEGDNGFNKILSQYGVNEKMLRSIYLEELKSTYVYNHVFENAILVVGDEEKEEYLQKNYVRIRHIYINNAYDKDKSDYDEDGNYIMADLDSGAKAEKDAKVASARAELASGADFDSVYEKYSEEKAYKNGYYICANTSDLPTELITNAFNIEVGETADFETEYGTHIIKRLETDEGAYKNDENKDFFEDFKDDVYADIFNDYMRSYFDKITVDESVINRYSIREVLPNYTFQY